MSSIQEIEAAIEKLPTKEFAKLREWMDELEAQEVDRKLEAAIKAGFFDEISAQAHEDLKNGKCREIEMAGA